MYVKNNLEHFAFNISLTSLIRTRLMDQLASRGSVPPMAILIELYLDWNVCAISIIPSSISSGESWNKLFVPYRTTTFLRLDMTGTFGPAIKHSELYRLLYHNLRVFRGSRYFSQTLRYLFSPAAIESVIIIVLKQFVIEMQQRWRWKFNQFVFENLIEGIVVIMIYSLF